MPIIEVNHLSKEFRLGQLHSIKLSMQRMIARLNGHPLPERVSFKALDDVHFNVEAGEVLGIIGTNGAGKSTLLKILARITIPSEGTIRVAGSVAPLIEVGAGLVGELTGRENIYLNAAILGMARKEITRKFDDIVQFSELEQFLDTPIKRYSSGMAVRLGFSIAAAVDAQILIVDEVLAVGDLAFQRKCFDRMEDMIKRQGKTVLLVSHNIRQVERLCDRVILLERGRILADGDATETCTLFYERSDHKIRQAGEEMLKRTRDMHTSGEVELLEVHLVDARNNKVTVVSHNADVTVIVRFRANVELVQPTFGIGVHTTDFVYLATDNSEGSMRAPDMAPGIHEVSCRVKHFPFLPGVYALRLGITVGEFAAAVFYAENVFFFQVTAEDIKPTRMMREGVIALDTEWSVARAEDSHRNDVAADSQV